MPRTARIIYPGVPHHITQRAVQQREVFGGVDDLRLYYSLMKKYSKKEDVAIHAYCLMPNHVHMVLTPSRETALSKFVGGLHRDFAFKKNQTMSWSGHLWQDRYYSTPLDEAHAITAVRYIELNPLRAGIVTNPVDYDYSSARTHAGLRAEELLQPADWLPTDSVWMELLESGMMQEEIDLLRNHTQRGVPLGKFSR